MFLCGLLESLRLFLPDLRQLTNAFKLGFFSQVLLVFQFLLMSERGSFVIAIHVQSNDGSPSCS